ncbi:hypothetical protein A3C60_01820 [Candidatus Nomurabacteria bacterium RIFCSPHIGHO2_02_FULL_37_45]|uniref:Toxin YoeB n=1 Tax=Candidatus Nomurabacteria bacterium RIFCSPHIGHO2_12_FULL_37_29 TaxID=1801759 RepID=A0A1F6WA60_9BACT|nr:MAG: hypothetical protein A2727_02180 [Candidatus Nomurabacteria bacterium RIFCSPHIGHO2_01_FULL_37_110]OGI71157.1 MAG: hypothetical protein A3C60_01820 [Candidatus Nomurabacteria bacterium RIFCSPHIGHO2_02_FULL_37_45]OGI78808.1 MAG: hypothetical protein A3F19_00825 [Candidatus Nomurabacteria bacterium RIFCSPHIGHO2_12_FULL_37_29]
MEVSYSNSFRKDYKKLDSKIRGKFQIKLRIFQNDPFNYVLNNHSIHHPYDGCRSINITGDIRALYELKNNMAHFFHIGSHSELYK